MTLDSSGTTVINQLSKRDDRREMFARAVTYVNFEKVPGSIMEFGVFAGASLALLAHGHLSNNRGMERRVVGFDSFQGLPASQKEHARWQPGWFAKVHSWHPLLMPGDPVTPEAIADLFKACALPEPDIEAGPFEVTMPEVIPSKYPEVALLHVDCDLYESARLVLEGVMPALQDGCLVLFDDWFNYKGNPQMGEARAFGEFLKNHPEWGATHYSQYGVFCNSFIMYRK